MMAGWLENWAGQWAAAPAGLSRAMAFLRETDFGSMPAGRIELEGERMYALLSESVTRSPEAALGEAHGVYADVHYVLDGAERIGFAPAADGTKVKQDLLKTEDVVLYDRLVQESCLYLRKGMYAVFLPGEIHRPGMHIDAPASIRKVVVKIRLDRLNA
ncbi:YhcH/YjgK/YiaL family protein [Cohnella rhizosphaerae]|uniref:YhcH/YjgK/YiaL family protein n=1 Tax=Cohnella rhizosphaerae TaxID=1457232 RepID=A0A9X4KYQ8_9BACL|nr:YhcH/YjgK/YiaL family protein [Cohnella rhizosphaerae]MDG0813377.1 YhcH/YjgK/YiaL family protein [Cohnella rhizosphaerae]